MRSPLNSARNFHFSLWNFFSKIAPIILKVLTSDAWRKSFFKRPKRYNFAGQNDRFCSLALGSFDYLGIFALYGRRKIIIYSPKKHLEQLFSKTVFRRIFKYLVSRVEKITLLKMSQNRHWAKWQVSAMMNSLIYFGHWCKIIEF